MKLYPATILALACATGACTQSSPNSAPTAGSTMQAKIETSAFGRTTTGDAVELYTLTNAKGTVAKVMTYGALLTELRVPDRNGQLGDVVLGFDTLDGYLKEHPYMGATIGRVANRIAKGSFTLDGKTYALATNNGPNHLHGGLKGFDKVLWKAEPVPTSNGVAVKFSYTSPDGEEGYPGTVSATVTYTLNDQNELRLDYSATADKATPVNLTNHSYWNLAGQGDILGHNLTIFADRYTPVDDTLIPTGELAPVVGTPMDFTKPQAIGSRIQQLTNKPRGYDHNYVLNGETGKLHLAARVSESKTGRVMEIWTTEPGVQFYSGNFLDGSLTGKRGTVYPMHHGFCLETQHFPDAVNHPQFASVILRPGQTYTHTTVHKFSTR
jgi:aldose 1-epimerase